MEFMEVNKVFGCMNHKIKILKTFQILTIINYDYVVEPLLKSVNS